MTPSCRTCGQQHETFLDGVVCDVDRYGPDRALARLTFAVPTDAADLVEQAQQVIASR